MKTWTFRLDGRKTTVVCNRPAGDVSDIVVRVPLHGRTPTQEADPLSRGTWKIVATHALPVNDRLAVAEVDVIRP